MPIYEYRCKDCDHVFEEWQKNFEEHVETCPLCGGESPRIMSNTSFILKGSGWYVTDYGRSGGGNGSSNGNNGANGKAESSSKTDTASTAAKTESAKADAPKKSESSSTASGSATT